MSNQPIRQTQRPNKGRSSNPPSTAPSTNANANPSAHPADTASTTCIVRCSMCFRAVSAGATCPHGRWSPIPFVVGRRWGCLSRCNTHWSHSRVAYTDAGRPKRWRWTVRVCRPPKKGGTRVRRREESQRAQTAQSGGFAGGFVRGGGDGRRCVGCAWGVCGCTGTASPCPYSFGAGGESGECL